MGGPEGRGGRREEGREGKKRREVQGGTGRKKTRRSEGEEGDHEGRKGGAGEAGEDGRERPPRHRIRLGKTTNGAAGAHGGKRKASVRPEAGDVRKLTICAIVTSWANSYRLEGCGDLVNPVVSTWALFTSWLIVAISALLPFARL